MGLLRLMGNKADVVKGLAKRCNENWSMAPKSDIVRPSALWEKFLLNTGLVALTGLVPLRHPRPSDHYDAELESLRKAPLALALQLPRADLDRDDRCEQPDQ